MHVAIIMNGNAEWAGRHGLPSTVSHAAGVSALHKTVALAADLGIKTLTIYALCNPDCGRPRQEIDADLSVLGGYLGSDTHNCSEQPVRNSVIGSSEWRSVVLPAAVNQDAHSSTQGSQLHLRIVVDYSAQDSIVRGAWHSADPDPLGRFNRQLSEIDPTALPAGPVDLLVRTGRGRCQSEFMLWEVAYAKLHYVDCLWPDFTGRDFERALEYCVGCDGPGTW